MRKGLLGLCLGFAALVTSAAAQVDPAFKLPSKAHPLAETSRKPSGNYKEELFGKPKNPRTFNLKAKPASTTEKGKVIRADFTRKAGEPETKSIQPVSGSALPFPEDAAFGSKPYTRSGKKVSPIPIVQPPTGAKPKAMPPLAISPRETIQPAAAESAVPTAPTGPQTATLTVEWSKQGQLNVGQTCECKLAVRNSGRSTAKEVVVDVVVPNSVTISKVVPKPTQTGRTLSWSIDKIAAGEAANISVWFVPKRRGNLGMYASARFTSEAGATFKVEEPLLKVAASGAKEVNVGDPAAQIITVSNPGTGLAQNIKVEATIPAGLENPRGRTLSMDIGSINPGETRKLRLPLVAISGGSHQVKITVTADGGLTDSVTVPIKITAPSLKVAVAGPRVRYVGRTADYKVTVTNDGKAASSNVRAVHRVPRGFKFVNADRGGKYDAATGLVSWFVGRLEAAQSMTLTVRLEATTTGAHVHQSGAISEAGAKAETRLTTSVEGTASLVLEIVDENDPVEVGRTTSYEIRVKNTGSKAAGNVGLSCELPQGVKLVGAKGPSSSFTENGIVVFKSLPTLVPGKAAIYRLQVIGTTDGNHRFRARLASDSIKQPLIFEEMTKFYRD